MAVSFDTSTESHTSTSGDISHASFSFTHAGAAALSAGGHVSVIIFNTSAASDVVTSVTYGGVNLTAVAGATASDTVTEAGYTSVWELGTGVPSGSQTVVVNRTNNANELYAVCITSLLASTKDGAATGVQRVSENATLGQLSVDDGSPGSNSLRYAGAFSGSANVIPTGAASTTLQSIDFGARVVLVVRETTAGQGARSVGFAAAAADDAAAVYWAVKEIKRTHQLTAALALVDGNTATMTKVLNFTAALALTATEAGTLNSTVALTANLALADDRTATMTAIRALSAGLNLTEAQTASMTRVATLAAALAITAAAGASATRIASLVANMAEADSFSANMTRVAALSAALGITDTMVADMTRVKNLSAALGIVVSQTADMTVTPGGGGPTTHDLEAALALVFSQSANMTQTVYMAANLAAAANRTATMTRVASLQANLQATAAIAAQMTLVHYMSASLGIVLNRTAILEIVGDEIHHNLLLLGAG